MNPEFTQYLIAVGANQAAQDRDTLMANVTQAFLASGVEPQFGLIYTSQYHINPLEIGLRDAWLHLTDEQRRDIEKAYPALGLAISLMNANNADLTIPDDLKEG